MARVALVMELSSTVFSRSTGGLDTACQSHLSGIVKYGSTEHTYLVIAFTHFDDIAENGTTEVLSENVRVLHHNFHLRLSGLGRFLPNFLYRELTVRSAIKAFKPHIIHSHIPTLPLSRYGAKTKLITLHSWKKIARDSHGFLNDLLYEFFLQPIGLFSSTKVSTVSRDIEKLFYGWRRRAGRELRYVPNPVSEKFMVTPRTRERSAFPRVLVSGAVIPRKRVIECIDVFEMATRSCPEARLRFAGRYDESSPYFSSVQRHIRDLGIEGRVEFLSSLDSDDLISEIDASWCVLSMSSDETFGLAPLEAMVRAKPAVVTRVGVFDFDYETITQAGASIVDVGDTLAASRALQRVIVGQEAAVDSNRIKRLYSPDVQVRAFENMYFDV